MALAIVTAGTSKDVMRSRTLNEDRTELLRTEQGNPKEAKVEWQSGDAVLLSEDVWSEDDNGIAVKLDASNRVWRGTVDGVLHATAVHYAD